MFDKNCKYYYYDYDRNCCDNDENLSIFCMDDICPLKKDKSNNKIAVQE
jgi:hypothetical protein